MLKTIFRSVGILVLGAVQASAAVVYVNEGTASVSTGEGFRPIASGTEVGPGNKVIVSQGGSVTVVYSPSCQETVGSGQVVTVQPEIPCLQASNSTGSPASAASGALGVPSSTLVIGGLVVAGGVGLAVGLSGGGGNGGHSP